MGDVEVSIAHKEVAADIAASYLRSLLKSGLKQTLDESFMEFMATGRTCIVVKEGQSED